MRQQSINEDVLYRFDPFDDEQIDRMRQSLIDLLGPDSAAGMDVTNGAHVALTNMPFEVEALVTIFIGRGISRR